MPSIRLGIGIDRTQPSGVSYVQATGGTITYDGDYKIHTFTTGDTFTVTKAGLIEFLLAGAGAGAGGGGGAGGELRHLINYNVATGAFTITIGAKGVGATAGGHGNGTNGGNSSFDILFTSLGGGAGGKDSVNGFDGGNGGGAGADSATQRNGGAGLGSNAKVGGNTLNFGAPYPSGGGAGAGSNGGNTSADAVYGLGGDGVPLSISGASITYCKGGDGYTYSGNNNGTINGTNYGDGGKGNTSLYKSGDGVQGIFIVKYKYR